MLSQSRHPHQTRPKRSPSRAWAVVLLVLVLCAAVTHWWMRRNSDIASSKTPDALESATNSVMVPHQVLQYWKQLDRPEADGWETEVLAQAADQQLKNLGKILIKPKALDLDSLVGLVTKQCLCSGLMPVKVKTVFSSDLLDVTRAAVGSSGADETTQKQQGLHGFAAALQELLVPFQQATSMRCKFKVFRVDKTTESFTTRQYFSLIGNSPEGIIEQHATWQASWTLPPWDSTPQLLSLAVEDWEQVVSRSADVPLFTDCTRSVLADNDCYRNQLMRGLNHWLDRLQEGQYNYIVGTPGIALGDVNGDGLDDLYLCQETGLPNRLFVQNTDGTLQDVSSTSGVNWLENSRSALLVDLDNDGDQDLAVAILGGLVLARNDGNGQFEVQEFLANTHDTMSLSAADYDRDGLLDLYVCGYMQNTPLGNEVSQPIGGAGAHFVYHDANDGGANVLYRNETDADGWKFSDATESTGLDVNNRRWSLAAAWEDFDNDGDQDLYVANDFGRNNLYENDGGRFRDVAATVGVEDSASGMAVAWGDYDRNGHMDLYVSNMFSAAGNRITFQSMFKPDVDPQVRRRLQRFARGNTLLTNQGDRIFRDTSVAAGVTVGRWGWGTGFVDLNNDGWEDLVAANGYITGVDSGDL